MHSHSLATISANSSADPCIDEIIRWSADARRSVRCKDYILLQPFTENFAQAYWGRAVTNISPRMPVSNIWSFKKIDQTRDHDILLVEHRPEFISQAYLGWTEIPLFLFSTSFIFKLGKVISDSYLGACYQDIVHLTLSKLVEHLRADLVGIAGGKNDQDITGLKVLYKIILLRQKESAINLTEECFIFLTTS